MKKISICIALAVALLLTACGKKNQQLIAEIEQANSECPVVLNDNCVMDSITYDEHTNTMTLSYTVDSWYSQVFSNGESQKEALSSVFTTKETEGMLKLLIEAKASLICSFNYGTGSSKVTFTPEELAAIKSRSNDPRTLLTAITAASKVACPLKIDENLTMTDIEVTDHYLIFTYDVEGFDRDQCAEVKELIREELRNSLREELQHSTGTAQLEIMKRGNFGVQYVYGFAGDSEPLVFTITAEEIQQF
ncbi:MAG: hypothetical protein K2J38_01960 [Muribaculaceae bacterium]|nr:hypothetical protein [Muribaculaceae bacterium]